MTNKKHFLDMIKNYKNGNMPSKLKHLERAYILSNDKKQSHNPILNTFLQRCLKEEQPTTCKVALSFAHQILLENNDTKDKSLLFDIMEMQGFLYYVNSKHDFSNLKDNLFIITDKIMDELSKNDLPNISLQDMNQYYFPSVYVFEDGDAISIVKQYNEPIQQDVYCLTLYDYYGNFTTATMQRETTLKEMAGFKMDEDLLKKILSVLNVLCLVQSKNVAKEIVYDELNVDIAYFAKQKANASTDKIRQKIENTLSKIPSYKFIDLDLLVEKVKTKYAKSDNSNTKKTPHWRSAHYHAYWTKKPNGEMEKIWHWIPLVAVNGIQNQQELYRVIK